MTTTPDQFALEARETASKNTGLELDSLQREVLEWAKLKGWEPDPDRTLLEEVALVTSELSEALEAWRTNGFERWSSYTLSSELLCQYGHISLTNLAPEPVKHLTADQVFAITGKTVEELELEPAPEGVAAEFAGAFIRLLHYCTVHEVDLAQEYRRCMDHNWGRAYRPGNLGA